MDLLSFFVGMGAMAAIVLSGVLWALGSVGREIAANDNDRPAGRRRPF